MSNHVSAIIQKWHANRDKREWVLGVVYQTKGPCYRKAGALMLLSDSGDRLGLLSGGCLEVDIQLQARKVIQRGKPLLLSYDGSDEDDISFQLGIGCGGTVDIALLPLNQNNKYMYLGEAYQALQERKQGVLTLPIVSTSDERSAVFRILNDHEISSPARYCTDADGTVSLSLVVRRSPHILVVGGGVDAIPVVDIASSLGWEVTLWDSRPANARAEHFGNANTLLTENVEKLGDYVTVQGVSGVLLMSHNISLDAAALMSLKNVPLRYLGLLGPPTRRADVLQCANLTDRDVTTPICGPAGYKLGGELPESIAMSILAECHASIYSH